MSSDGRIVALVVARLFLAGAAFYGSLYIGSRVLGVPVPVPQFGFGLIGDTFLFAFGFLVVMTLSGVTLALAYVAYSRWRWSHYHELELAGVDQEAVFPEEGANE